MGIGVGHVAFAYLFRSIGVEGGADIFNTFLIVQFLTSLPGGLVFLKVWLHDGWILKNANKANMAMKEEKASD